ncbi:unnamed protein product [Amoebophrya sp. A25]|nr:unnamed protein product [Amoebophrya sp. A25]|eukprot:GSA25T00025266001.1
MVERDDTFHKMSKKIAQLTKVIFHLNTKNDEADLHLKSVSGAYEQEVELIVRNCNNKIHEAWTAFEKCKRDIAERERSRGEKDKDNSLVRDEALKQLEGLKQKHAQKEQETFRHWTERCSTLSEELDELRTRCREQRDAFERQIENEREHSEKSAEEQRLALRNEVETVSAKLDEERILLQAKIRSLEETKARDEESWKKRLQAEKGTLGEQVEKLHKLLDEKDASITSIQGQLDTLQKSSASELKDIEIKRRHLEQERDRVVQELDTLKSSSSQAEKDLSEERLQLQKQVGDLNRQVTRLEREVEVSHSKLAEREKEFTKLKSDSSMNSREAQDTLERLRDSHMLDKKRWEEQKNSADAEKKVFEEKLEGAETKHRELEADLRRFEADRDTRAADLRKSEEKATELQQKLDDLNSTLDASSSSLRGELEAARIRHAEELETLKADFAAAEARFEENRASDAASAARDLEALKKEHAERLKELEHEHNATTDALNRSHVERVEELQRTIVAERDKVKNEGAEGLEKVRAEHEAALTLLQSRLEEEQSVRRNLEDLGGDTAKQLNATKEALQVTESEAAKLMEEGKTGRERIQTLEQRIAQLEEKHSSAIQRMKDDLNVEHQECRSAKEDNINLQRDLTILRGEKAELERTVKLREEMVQKLEQQLEDKERGIGAVSSEAREKIELVTAQMNKQLNDAKDDAVKMVQELTQQHQQKIGDIYEKHTAELDRIKQRHNVELSEKMKGAEAQRENALAQMKARHDGELAQLDGSLRMEMQEMRRRFEVELATASARFDALETDKRTLEGQNSALERELRQSCARVEALQGDVERLRGDLAEQERKMREFVAGSEEHVRKMQEDFERREEQMRSGFAAERQALENRHSEEVSKLNGVRARIEEDIRTLQSRIAELEELYESRPSRPEDIEQIRYLERECRERETAFNQLRDEMQFYKLELVNREQNYNKVFGVSGPNVGVLNPVSAYTGVGPSQPGAGPQGRRPSDNRTRNGGTQQALGNGLPPLGGSGPAGVAVAKEVINMGQAPGKPTGGKRKPRPVSGGERRPTLENVNDGHVLMYK